MTDRPFPDRHAVSEGFAHRDDAENQLQAGDIGGAIRGFVAAAYELQADGLFDEAFATVTRAMTTFEDAAERARRESRRSGRGSGTPRVADLSPFKVAQLYECFFATGDLLAASEEHRSEVIRDLLARRGDEFRRFADSVDLPLVTGTPPIEGAQTPRAVSMGYEILEAARRALMHQQPVEAVRAFVAAANQFLEDGRFADAFSAATAALTNLGTAVPMARVDEEYRDAATGRPKIEGLGIVEVAQVYGAFLNAGELHASDIAERAHVIRMALADRSAAYGQVSLRREPGRGDLSR